MSLGYAKPADGLGEEDDVYPAVDNALQRTLPPSQCSTIVQQHIALPATSMVAKVHLAVAVGSKLGTDGVIREAARRVFGSRDEEGAGNAYACPAISLKAERNTPIQCKMSACGGGNARVAAEIPSFCCIISRSSGSRVAFMQAQKRTLRGLCNKSPRRLGSLWSRLCHAVVFQGCAGRYSILCAFLHLACRRWSEANKRLHNHLGPPCHIKAATHESRTSSLPELRPFSVPSCLHDVASLETTPNASKRTAASGIWRISSFCGNALEG
jgi:hypothetical protein